MHADDHLTGTLARRAFLRNTGVSLGGLALGMLLNGGGGGARAAEKPRPPLAARAPHFTPRAKRVIYLNMIGGPSQLDLFDNKPALVKNDGRPCPEEYAANIRSAFIGSEMILAGSRYRFARHGESGQEMSELLPHLAAVADDITVVRGLHTEEVNHGPAQLFLHTGFGRGGRPSFGSWVTYGLGSESEDLPAFVVLSSGPQGGSGSLLYSSGFLPTVYQGVPFRSSGEQVLFLSNPKGHGAANRRAVLDAVQGLNRARLDLVGDPEIGTRISQYETAYRMQTSVPRVCDLSAETAETLKMYGVESGKPSFARNCLLARRLVEAGVRLVELYDANWDHHQNLDENLRRKCKDVDQGMAALVQDLKRRGLLRDTLVIWGGEFGRTPLRQSINANGPLTSPGRDHHREAFTVWLAGGGVKPGLSYGRTDDLGWNAVEGRVHVHDLNATVLHLLGLDHEKLTYKYQGREFRLTDVHGEVVQGLLT